MSENNWTEPEADRNQEEVLRLRRELRVTQEALSRASSALQRVDESQSRTLNRLQKIDKTADHTLRTLERRKKREEEINSWYSFMFIVGLFVYFLDWLSPGSTWIKTTCAIACVYFLIRAFVAIGHGIREECSKQEEPE